MIKLKRPSAKQALIITALIIGVLFIAREILVQVNLSQLANKHQSNPAPEPSEFTRLADHYASMPLSYLPTGNWVYRKCSDGPCGYRDRTYLELTLFIEQTRLRLSYTIVRAGDNFYSASLDGSYQVKGSTLLLDQAQGAVGLLFDTARIPLENVDRDRIKIWLDQNEPILLVKPSLLPQKPRRKTTPESA